MSLKGVVFAVTGTLTESRANIKKKIEKNGGKMASSVTKAVTHLIAAPGEYDNETTKIKQAKNNKIFIVKEKFLDDAISNKKLPKLTSKYLWGAEEEESEEESEEPKTKTNKRKKSEQDSDSNSDSEKKSKKKKKIEESIPTPTNIYPKIPDSEVALRRTNDWSPYIQFTGKQSLVDLDRKAVKITMGYDDEQDEFMNRWKALMANPNVTEIQGLVIGCWSAEQTSDDRPDDALAAISSSGKFLPNLKYLFFGDIKQERAEISWIAQGNVGCLLDTFPNLVKLKVKGSEGLKFDTQNIHMNLKTLVIHCGGLGEIALKGLLNGNFPNLETLEIWLGEDNYGADWQMTTLKQLFLGITSDGKPVFPNLKHLSLCNSEKQDECVLEMTGTPILTKLESLDLSMGSLSDKSATSLLLLANYKNLKKFTLNHHYASLATVELLKKTLSKSGMEVDIGFNKEQGKAGEDERYIAVGE